MKSIAIITGLLLSVPLSAQDTRRVTKPTIPPVCTILKAHLHATNNALAEADETQLDTHSIQDAIDTCGAGKAVELAHDGERNAFLSAPLELREGVTLLIDQGVTLYASRNPKDFETSPGTCGISGADARPCKALISVNVKNAAIMGEGADAICIACIGSAHSGGKYRNQGKCSSHERPG
jgi:polygalacturonase